MHPTHAFTADPSVPAAQPEKPGGRMPNAGAVEKRKVVRRDPEKRRAQNLQAQKKYREKLRKRLGDLEMIAASVAKARQEAPAAAAGTVPVITETVLPVTPISHQSSPSDQDPHAWNVSEPVTGSMPHGFQAVPPEETGSLVHNAQEPSMSLSLWDPAIFIDPSYLLLDKASKVPDEGYWYTSYVDCGCPVRHVEIRSRKPGTLDTVQLFTIGESTMSADPYANSLRVEMHCTVDAIWKNCLHLGVSELVFCQDDSLSPFYRPGAGRNAITDSGHEASDAVVRTVQSIFKTLKPDLRPTKEQITIPHHPCVDIVPFPTLRNNLLKGVVFVDEDDLFHDMLQGLICWGGAGISKKERNGATGKASSGTPWDSRSWEGKPWFLRKYWTLLGGEDSELVRQSEWWRELRDEEEDIWSDACNSV